MTAHKGDKSGGRNKATATGRGLGRSSKAGGFLQKAAKSGQFRSGSVKRGSPEADLPRIGSHQIVWASGQGTEIATLRGDLGEIMAAARKRMKDGVLTDRASFVDEGPDSALVVGPPGRTLACLVASEEMAPGIVAVIGDAEGDQAEAIGAVERVLGRGFEVHPHAI